MAAKGTAGNGSAPDLSLVFPGSDGQPLVFPIPEGTVALGRAADNDLVLDDASIEPHQVVLTRTGDRLELRGLFAGTTKVNGTESQKVQLKPGDVITLGDVKLRLMKVAGSKGSGGLKRGQTTRLGRASSTSSRRTRASQEDPPTRTGTEGSRQTTRQDPQDDAEGRRARERDARRARALARARQLSDEIMHEDDFEVVFERLAGGFLDVFAADRAVTVLFEEDGINPLMVVERRRDGTAEGTGIAQEIISRCLQVRSVIRVAGGYQGLGGLAAPLLTESRALGMLYFERVSTPGSPLGADDVHLMALLTNIASLKIAPLVQ
ncbi:MAG: FHA domain-containing protein [Planctomycetes bacterium]|nr:FHA domain-containing protein [Planctomycetota bacterium]